MSRSTAPADAFASLAAALAEWPTLTRRLLADHPTQAPGALCPSCSTPGGRLAVEAPCPVRSLALLAQRIAARGQA